MKNVIALAALAAALGACASTAGHNTAQTTSAAPTGPSVRHYTCYNTGPFGMTARQAARSTTTWVVSNDYQPTASEPFKTKDIDALMRRRAKCVRR